VGSLGAAWLGGWLADRLGRNIAMALSAFAGAVCMPLYDHHPDLLWGINAALGVLAAILILSKRGHAVTIT